MIAAHERYVNSMLTDLMLTRATVAIRRHIDVGVAACCVFHVRVARLTTRAPSQLMLATCLQFVATVQRLCKDFARACAATPTLVR